MPAKLEGKVALITGGTTGIGRATARLFHEEGARVIVTGRNPATLDAARELLPEGVEVVASDSGDSAAAAMLFAQIADRYKKLDILFLNAGIVPQGTIEAMTEEAFDEAIRINVKGPWLALKHAAPLLSRGGSVVLTGSISAHRAWGAYGVSKAAVRSLGRAAAAEFAPRGVRVNVVSPGPTDSGVIEKGRDAATAAAIRAQLAERVVMKRLGTVDEIARAALFLASDDSSFITGEEIVVDGGMTRV